MANALANAVCERCRGGFAPAEKIVNNNGELYHEPSVCVCVPTTYLQERPLPS
uniref:Uncharacterized protein n=1 Tax=Naja naja TaxID=35670 RepID=A0A8C7E403_NAJNA